MRLIPRRSWWIRCVVRRQGGGGGDSSTSDFPVWWHRNVASTPGPAGRPSHVGDTETGKDNEK